MDTGDRIANLEAEARIRGRKSFGERIAAVRHCRSELPIAAPSVRARRATALQWLTPDRQAAGIHIRVALMNRFNALGTAEIVRVA